jgi:hypothetical protein
LRRDLQPLPHAAGIGARAVRGRVDLDAAEPARRRAANAAVVALADRHQALADIGAGRHRHAKPERGILMHVAPVGPRQEAALRLAERRQVTRHAVPHAVQHAAGAGFDLAAQQLQQGRFSGARLANHRDDLAFVKLERDIAAAELAAVPFGQAFGDQQRLVVVGHCVTGDRLMRKLTPCRSKPSDS